MKLSISLWSYAISYISALSMSAGKMRTKMVNQAFCWSFIELCWPWPCWSSTVGNDWTADFGLLNITYKLQHKLVLLHSFPFSVAYFKLFWWWPPFKHHNVILNDIWSLQDVLWVPWFDAMWWNINKNKCEGCVDFGPHHSHRQIVGEERVEQLFTAK